MRTTPIILTAAILGTYCLPGESAAASTVAAEHGSSVTRKYRLYHSFGASGTNDDDDFVERGIVTLSSSDPATEALTAAVAVVEGADGSLPAERVDEMVAGGGMYRIRAVEDGGGGATAMASVPGCDVRRANFREEISLTLGHTGSLLSISYKPLVSPLAPACDALRPLAGNGDSESPELKFITSVSYGTSTPGMAVSLVLPQTRPPPGLKFYPRKDGGGTAGGGKVGSGPKLPGMEGDKAENKSFLVKYWYIILPIALMALTGSKEEPPPPQRGDGSGGHDTVQASEEIAPASMGGRGTAPAAGGGGQKVRRGKRG